MSKFLTATLLLAFVALSFAGKITEQKARVITGDENIDVKPYTGPIYQLPQLNKVAAEAGDTLGVTVYDYSTNSVTGRQLVNSANGVHITYMNRQDPSGARFVTYDFFDFSQEPFGFFGNQSVTEERSTGWGNVANGPNDEVLGVMHGGGEAFWKDDGEAFYSFTEGLIPGMGGVFPRIDASGNSVVVTGQADDGTYVTTISEDLGANWGANNAYPQNADTAVSLGNAENVVMYASNGDLVSVYMGAGGTQEGMWLARSSDNGASWTNTLLYADATILGDNSFHWPENFGQVNFVLDNNDNVHLVFNGYGGVVDAADPDSITHLIFPVVYWNEADGQLIDLTSENVGRNPDLSDAISAGFPGNGIGSAYPNIAVSADGMKLAAIWQQPEVEGNALVGAYDATGDSVSGLYATDIYGATSGDGGANWSEPFHVAGMPSYSDVHPQMSQNIIEDGGNYYIDIAYLVDYSPGVSLFGEGTAPLIPWVYQRVQVDIATSIEDDLQAATSFELFQNYPNPFNPSTQIAFNLKKAATVNVEVFNALGQKVATLIDGKKMSAGPQTVEFNAENLASGVYFYKLNADGFEATKKMLLVK